MERLQMLSSDLERVPILGYDPLSGEKRDRTRVDWSAVGIRVVTDNDVASIATWVATPREASWVGSEGPTVTVHELRMWMAEAFVSCVITFTQAAHEAATDAVAFATLAPIPELGEGRHAAP